MLTLQMAKAQDKIPINEQDYSNSSIEMADQMRADGKIYVVVGVIVVIFIGLGSYMVSLDRKIGKLEKEINHSEH